MGISMQEFQPDETINNRYRVVRKLGAGAMGSVYLCQDSVENNIKVALKVLVSDDLDDQDVWAKGEYEALTRLRHPNLARVHNFGLIEGRRDYFIVSEFIKGIDLFSATEYLKYDEIVDILVQICRALEYIHSQGYVHFDVKPDNILVSRHKTLGLQDGSKVQYEDKDFDKTTLGTYDKPVVKLIDFGLAEKITGSFSFAIKGTLNYLAPEILSGTTPDKRADLYSLGVTLYQVVNRDLPFYQEPQFFQNAPTFNRRSELFEANMKKHPEYLRETILRLIEENPSERFQSAKEVIQFINKNSGHTYEVETEETRASYFQSPRLVGRKKEMNLLKHHYEMLFHPQRSRPAEEGDETGEEKELEPPDPAAGAAPVIVVNGEMGAGKSRLLEEFQHFLKLNGTNVYWGNCYEGNARAYRPIIEVLSQLIFAVGPQSDLIRRHEEHVRLLVPQLGGRESAGSARDLSSGEKEKQRFIDRMAQLMVDAARLSPYVMVLNNLHWIDEASLDLLAKLLERIDEHVRDGQHIPLLIVASQRPEEQRSERARELLADAREKGLCLEVPVRRLRRSQIAELLRAMLRISEIPDEFVGKLEEQTGGNPLFLVETLKALEDEGIIKQQADGWAIRTTKYSRVEIPHRMEDLLLKRIERIEPARKEILRMLAVLDKPVSPKFLQQFQRFSRTAILVELRELESTGIVQKTFENGKLHFAIQQPKVREILYSNTEEELRRALHGEVGAAYEELYRHREEEILEDLAYHYQRSDKTDRAMRLAVRAGDRLKGIFANERAYEHYVYVLGEVMDRPEYVDVYFDTREKLGDTCTTLGRYEEAEEHYSALLVGDQREMLSPERVTGLYVRRGKVFEIQGDYEMALHCYKDARNYISTNGKADQTLDRARVFNSIGWIYVCMGKYEKAMTISLEALRVIQDVPEGIEHAMIYSTIGSANFCKGNAREAVKYHRMSLRIKEDLENIPEIVNSLNNLAEAHMANAEYGDAVDHLKRALGTAEEIGDPYGRAVTLHNLAHLHCAAGNLKQAIEYLDQSIDRSKAYNMRNLSLQNYIVRGMVYFEQGDCTKAEGDFFRVLTAFSKQGNRAGLCDILIRMAAVHRANSNLGEAHSMLEEAGRYAESLGTAMLRARCSLEEARLWRRRPEPEYDRSIEALREALSLAANLENPELLGEVHFETAETLVSMREVQNASEHYKAAEERMREVAESLPADLRDSYREKHGQVFADWRRSEHEGPAAPASPEEETPPLPALGERRGSLAGGLADPEENLRCVSELMQMLPTASTQRGYLEAWLKFVLEGTRAAAGFVLSVAGRELSILAARQPAEAGTGAELESLLFLDRIDRALGQPAATYLGEEALNREPRESGEAGGFECRSLAIFPLLDPRGGKGVLYLVNPEVEADRFAEVEKHLQPFLNLIPVALLHFTTRATSV